MPITIEIQPEELEGLRRADAWVRHESWVDGPQGPALLLLQRAIQAIEANDRFLRATEKSKAFDAYAREMFESYVANAARAAMTADATLLVLRISPAWAGSSGRSYKDISAYLRDVNEDPKYFKVPDTWALYHFVWDQAAKGWVSADGGFAETP